MSIERLNDFRSKVQDLRDIINSKKTEGLKIDSQKNFSYLTGGNGYIGFASTASCATIIVTLKKLYLVANNIESQRLYEEQLDKNKDVVIMEYPWYEESKKQELISQIVEEKKLLDEAEVADEISSLRTKLSDHNKEELRILCKESAIIVENICKDLNADITENELAGEISKRLWEANIEPITILIGFDERAEKYRHPVFVGNKLKNYALVAICTRRNGLICSLTRNVLLTSDDKMIEKHEKCAYVDAVFTSNIVAGEKLSDVFLKGVSAYEEVGYEGEYKHHHQGGLTGFMAREIKANVDTHHLIRVGEAYAFNPSIQGAKTEDTVLLTDNELEVLTYTGNYSYVEVEVDGITHIKPTVYVVNKK